MKIFPAKIYCFILYDYYSKRCEKKSCIIISMLSISLRLTDLNIYFYDVFSLVINGFKKRVYGNGKKFFPCDFMKMSQVAQLSTTCESIH